MSRGAARATARVVAWHCDAVWCAWRGSQPDNPDSVVSLLVVPAVFKTEALSPTHEGRQPTAALVSCGQLPRPRPAVALLAQRDDSGGCRRPVSGGLAGAKAATWRRRRHCGLLS